jgi:hypothetical protein
MEVLSYEPKIPTQDLEKVKLYNMVDGIKETVYLYQITQTDLESLSVLTQQFYSRTESSDAKPRAG